MNTFLGAYDDLKDSVVSSLDFNCYYRLQPESLTSIGEIGTCSTVLGFIWGCESATKLVQYLLDMIGGFGTINVRHKHYAK